MDTAIATDFSVNGILHSLLLSAGSAALGGLVYLMGQGATYVGTRIKNDQLRSAWALAADYAQRIVRDVGNVYVQPLKDSGQWNAGTAAKAKDMAVAQLKSMLVAQADAKAIKLPATAVGANLDSIASTFVESAVHDMQNTAAIALAAAVPAVAAAPVVNLVQHGLGNLEAVIRGAAAQPAAAAKPQAQTAVAAAGAPPANPTSAPVPS